MRRMVDDKEIIDFNNRITALEEAETGLRLIAGNGIDIQTGEVAEDKIISVDDTVETKANATNRFVSKANLTDYSINDIIVADSEIQSGEVDLRAVSAQDVKSEISLDPTSAIIKTTSGTNNSTIGVSGTEIDLTTNVLKYNSKEIATQEFVQGFVSANPSSTTNTLSAISINNVNYRVPACQKHSVQIGSDQEIYDLTVRGISSFIYSETQGDMTFNYPAIVYAWYDSDDDSYGSDVFYASVSGGNLVWNKATGGFISYYAD